MAKMLIPVRLRAGDAAISGDARLAKARFVEIYRSSDDPSRGYLWTGWNSPEDADEARQEFREPKTLATDTSTVDGEPAVMVRST